MNASSHPKLRKVTSKMYIFMLCIMMINKEIFVS